MKPMSVDNRSRASRKRKNMDLLAVSEAIGTILMLSVTTVLVGAVALWANQIPGPEEDTQIDLVADIDYDGLSDTDIYYITHQGGQVMVDYKITIQIKYADPATPDSYYDIFGSPFKLGDSLGLIGKNVDTNGYWELGETWSIKVTPALSPTKTISIQVLYQGKEANMLVLNSEFSKGVTGDKLQDLAIMSIAVLDPEGNGHLWDEKPQIDLTIANNGDIGSTPIPPANVNIRIFDGEKYMGTPTLDQNGIIFGYGNSGDTNVNDKIDVGETWVATLDTDSNATAADWVSSGGWSYTGRHTIYAKAIPLDKEKKYANNYANVFVSVSLTFEGVIPSGPDPEIDGGDVVLSNRNPKTGETVTITVYLKNKGDKPLVGNSDPNKQCWFVISTHQINRSGPSRNIFSWAPDTDDDDTTITDTQWSCVKKNISIPSAGQIQYTFTWVASASYPGQVRNIFLAVDVNHMNSSEAPGTAREVIDYAGGDTPDNNYDWISIQVMPKVLVVDNDGVESGNADDVASKVLEGLQGAGISVDGLVKATMTSPPYTDEGMKPYDIIIWVGGRSGAPISSTNLNNLTQAINDGKYVWLIGNQILRSLLAAPVLSPNVLSGGGGSLNTIMVPITAGEQFIYNLLGIQSFYTGANPIANTVLTVLDQSTLGKTIPSTLTNWMLGETTYDMAYRVTKTMELPHLTRVAGAGEEISQIISPSDNVLGTTYYNSIALNTSGGYKAVFTGFDFASLNSLNEEINITHTVMSWFNWRMNIGDDLAITDLRIIPATPKFMDTVNITVIARNNGQTLNSNFIMFYVTGEDGIERQIPTYGSDTNPVEVVISGGGQVIKTKSWLATETGLHTFRAMIDPYYILPEVSETNNDLSYSSSTTTTSLVMQNILIVDDDGGAANTNTIVNSVTSLGYPNTVWDYAVMGCPTMTDMKNYNTVVWNTGGTAGHIMDASVGGPQNQISDYLLGKYPEAKYLDKHNETVWLLGNGFVGGAGTFTAGNFFHDYFGVGAYSANTVSSSTNLVGTANNPISHGITYLRTGGANTDDRINKAADMSTDDTNTEVYFAGPTGTSCVGISHSNALDYYNTLLSTVDVKDFNVPGVPPSQDTQISIPNLPAMGYGGADRLRVGWTAAGDQRAALLQWDLSTIPATATIDSAVLKFYTTGMLGATVIPILYAQPINDNAWVEGTDAGTALSAGATWTQSSYPLTNWVGAAPRLQSSGLGINTVYTSSATNIPVVASPVTINVKATVQAWVSGSIPNHGLALTPWDVASPSSGENEIYSGEYANSDYWPTLIISYTDSGLSGQSPSGKENAVAEMIYMGMHWLALKDSRPDFRCTDIDISINDPDPQLGNSYVISANVWNIGNGAGSCTVRFLDGYTLIKTSTVYLEGGENVVEECIWVPLYAGSGSTSSYRTITVSLDPLNKVTEIFDTYNNLPATSIPVYFLYDDFEYDNQAMAEENWAHEATIVNINGESTLDFLDDAKTNIISEISNKSLSDTSWVHNYLVSHSVNSSFSIKEPFAVGTMNTALDIILVLDRSGSMASGGKTPLLKTAANTLVDLMDANDRVAAFGFDSSNDWLWDFITCDTAGKTLLHTNINALSNTPSGNTGICNSVGRDTAPVGTFNGNLDGEGGVQDDGAIPFMRANARVLADRNIIALSDGASNTDYTFYPTCINHIWNAAGQPTYIDNWQAPFSGSPVPRTTDAVSQYLADGTTPMKLKVYTIGLGITHDPACTPNPVEQQPTTTYTDERKMWRMSQESYVSWPGWTDNSPANSAYDAGELGGFGYFYAPTASELEDIFRQIANAMGSGGTTRGGGQAGTRAPVTTVTPAALASTYSSSLRKSGGTYTDTFDSYLRLGRTADPYQYRSIVTFDTTSIPDNAVISALTLNTNVGDATTNGTIAINRVTPTTPGSLASAQARWDECLDDVNYVTGSTSYQSTGAKTHALPAQACTDLQNQLGVNWFAVGIREEADDGEYGWIYSSSNANRPTLTVTYYPDDVYDTLTYNDAVGSAYPFGALIGTNTYNNLNMVDGEDWYTISGVALGQKIVVNLDFINTEGNLDLYLYAPDGVTPVASSLSTTDDEGISYTAAYTGTFYIRVSAPTSVHCTYNMIIYLPDMSGGPLLYPRNPYPAVASVDVALHPILSWSGGSPGTVDHYGIWIGFSESTAERIKDPDTGAPLALYGESYDTGVLQPMRTYYWYVVAYDDANEATASIKNSTDDEVWYFTIQSSGEASYGEPALDELNPMDTKAFTLNSAQSVTLTFYHKFNMAPTINGAYMMLGVKYRGGSTAWDLENPYNYRYYYIVPEETYNSNLYLGAGSFARPYLGSEGANFKTAASTYRVDYNGDGDTADTGEDQIMWCWNGKSSGGLFDWQQTTVDLKKEIDYINAHSSAGINMGSDTFKVRFSYFYFGAGNGGGWWVDDVKITLTATGTLSATSQDVWDFVKDSNYASSGSGCWWNGNPSNSKLMQAGIDNSLITKPIDLTRAVNARFSANFAYNINTKEGLPPDSLRIEISSDGGGTWKAVNYGVRSFSGVSVAGANPHASYKAASTEARINCDLSAWSGLVVTLRFRVVTTSEGTYAHNENNGLTWGGLYVDDVTVSGTSLEETRSDTHSFSGAGLASGMNNEQGAAKTISQAIGSADARVSMSPEAEHGPIFLCSLGLVVSLSDGSVSILGQLDIPQDAAELALLKAVTQVVCQQAAVTKEDPIAG